MIVPSDLSPVAVIADKNCLYNSIVLLMNDPTIGVAELRGLSFSYRIADNIELIYCSSCYYGNGTE